MSPFIIAIAVVIILAVLVHWRNAGLGFDFDREVVLTKSQRADLKKAQTGVHAMINSFISGVCANKQAVIDKINAADVNISCEQLRKMVASEITRVKSPNFRFAGDQSAVIRQVAKLWTDKALTRYCSDTLDKALYKKHMIRAVNDFCEPEGDFTRMLHSVADYVLIKPLSVMS